MAPDPGIVLIIFLAIVTFAVILLLPERGLYWRWRDLRRVSQRVYIEDALKHMYEYHMSGHSPTIESIAGAVRIGTDHTARLLTAMIERELVAMKDDQLQLTPVGVNAALHVIRAHRLWERFLADETGLDSSGWHRLADRYEHGRSAEELGQLERQLGYPTHDPHGDPIPSSSGQYVPHGGQPLPSMPINVPLRIVHLEDEPDVIYAQIVAEGLAPGQQVRITSRTPQAIRFWADGDEHVVAPVVAANISVVVEQAAEAPQAVERLSDLKQGESAIVNGIAPACRGAERRRFLDLGILNGTQVSAEFLSPSGDPMAYRIRETLIALRREQADLIFIRRDEAVS
jgi:DtxR family Mn-dependent transcriptional regulator